MDRQIDDFRVNSMALIILALYQKYSCLLFSERLRIDIRKGNSRLIPQPDDARQGESLSECKAFQPRTYSRLYHAQ